MVNSKRCNDLTGKEWLQNSFSIWRNLSKTPAERKLEHPASFPLSLAEKLIYTFSKEGGSIIDPFNGIGTTTLAAENTKRKALGIDLSDNFCSVAESRLSNESSKIICDDSFNVIPTLMDNSIDLCLTSPPYWDILNMRRTADIKENINYSNKSNDLGNIEEYERFIELLGDLFELIHPKLKERSYCLINVMDIRKKSKFYPLHMDLTIELEKRGFELDDIIIWDRQQDYNNMRPLGYPYKFRINKVHEYVMIFVKR